MCRRAWSQQDPKSSLQPPQGTQPHLEAQTVDVPLQPGPPAGSRSATIRLGLICLANSPALPWLAPSTGDITPRG